MICWTARHGNKTVFITVLSVFKTQTLLYNDSNKLRSAGLLGSMIIKLCLLLCWMYLSWNGNKTVFITVLSVFQTQTLLYTNFKTHSRWSAIGPPTCLEATNRRRCSCRDEFMWHGSLTNYDLLDSSVW